MLCMRTCRDDKINHEESPVLREGFTTGTAACAAALAALDFLLKKTVPPCMEVPLPPFREVPTRGLLARARLSVPVLGCHAGFPKEFSAGEREKLCPPGCLVTTGVVRKDAGDDPDVTHRALIQASVIAKEEVRHLSPSTALQNNHPLSWQECEQIMIRGGPGIGKITLPGLPLPVGEWAINPVPRLQIRYALAERFHALTSLLPPLTVVLSVPDGENLTHKTFNPRLGIIGGISILGTHGVVKPYSHAAFTATIKEELSLAKALGLSRLFFATGRRSERLLRQRFPEDRPEAFIQVADCAASALLNARKLGFSSLFFGCFIGKLVKFSQNILSTHARESQLDLRRLALDCSRLGLACAAEIEGAATAALALEYILHDPRADSAVTWLTRRAQAVLTEKAQQKVEICLFHTDGRLLADTSR